jgi:hypothetical protein
MFRSAINLLAVAIKDMNSAHDSATENTMQIERANQQRASAGILPK